jgi:hypothetical protein
MTVTSPSVVESADSTRRLRWILWVLLLISILVVSSSAYVLTRTRPLVQQVEQLEDQSDSIRRTLHLLTDSLRMKERQLLLVDSAYKAYIKDPFPAFVLIQADPRLQQTDLDSLRAKLNTTLLSAPGVQRIPGPIPSSNVRYFHDRDRNAAERVAQLAEQYFASRGCPKGFPRKIQHINLPSRPGQIEIWISPNCST